MRPDTILLQGPFVPGAGDSAYNPNEPSLAVGPAAKLFLAYHDGGSPSRVAATRSDDGGFTWCGPTWRLDDGSFRYADTPALLISEEFRLVAWEATESTRSHIRATLLDEHGRPADTSVRVQDDDPVYFGAFPRLCASGDVIVCAWYRSDGTGYSHQAAAARSFDGGTTWGPVEIIDAGLGFSDTGPEIAGDRSGIVYAFVKHPPEMRLYRTQGTGGDWEPLVVPQDDSRATRYDPAIAVAPDGTVGIAYDAHGLDELSAVWFSASSDGGMTWSPLVEVSHWAPSGHHGEPHLTCGPNGAWHIAWVRVTPWGADPDAFYSTLGPGDSAWTSPVRVNPEPWTVDAFVPRTLSIVADDDGYAYIAYPHKAGWNSDNIYVMTTRPRPYDPWEGTNWYRSTATPNPSSSPVTLHFPSPWPGTALIQLFDVRGRLIREWRDVGVSRGVHRLAWDGRAASGEGVSAGVYFWQVSVTGSEGRIRTRAKSVLLSR
jgi:hypothetical protein